jgi:hypothetical protein
MKTMHVGENMFSFILASKIGNPLATNVFSCMQTLAGFAKWGQRPLILLTRE